MKSRVVIVFAFIASVWTLMLFRSFVIQVLPNQKLQQRQNRLFQTQIQVQGRRGTIYDRNGEELAISAPAYSLFADPSILENEKKVARRLAHELQLDVNELDKKLKDKDKKFIWLKRKIEAVKADKIKQWQIAGLGFIEEPKRVYLSEELFAPIIGLVGQEGQGMEGVEKQFDTYLKPNVEKVIVKRDARGRPLQVNGLLVTESHDGQDVVLSVDREMQYRLKRDLDIAIRDNDADSAYGVILDAQTSEVLAMTAAQKEGVNNVGSQNLWRNRPIIDAFEPGSTMKTFVIGEALAEDLVKTNSRIFCENGKMRIGKKFIHEADQKHRFGFLSVTEVLALSSNIGAAKMGFMLGDEKLRDTFLKFGFGQKTGIELPGESPGILQELPWQKHLLSNISFGHGIAVTPLQVAEAYASIAAGGMLRHPTIIKNGNSQEKLSWWNQITHKNKGDMQHRVLTEAQANTLKYLLMAVTAPGGTGVNARVPGYLVAGKTGTAQKVDPNGKGYIKGGYISSFAGFIPADKPKFVIYVAVDSPRKQYYGSQVAAPLFADIASYVIRRDGVAPLVLHENALQSNAQETKNNSDDANLVAHSAGSVTANANASLGVSVSTNTNPHSNTASVAIPLLHDELKQITSTEVVPDFRNLTLREVQKNIEITEDSKLDLKILGDGNVVGEIDPLPGQPWPHQDHKMKIKMIHK